MSATPCVDNVRHPPFPPPVFRLTLPFTLGLLSPPKGPEGVAAAVAGEELPLPPGAAASLPRGIRGSAGTGGRSSMYGGGSSTGEKVESLADLLARAEGPGNLKEAFRLVRPGAACLPARPPALP